MLITILHTIHSFLWNVPMWTVILKNVRLCIPGTTRLSNSLRVRPVHSDRHFINAVIYVKTTLLPKNSGAMELRRIFRVPINILRLSHFQLVKSSDIIWTIRSLPFQNVSEPCDVIRVDYTTVDSNTPLICQTHAVWLKFTLCIGYHNNECQS